MSPILIRALIVAPHCGAAFVAAMVPGAWAGPGPGLAHGPGRALAGARARPGPVAPAGAGLFSSGCLLHTGNLGDLDI